MVMRIFQSLGFRLLVPLVSGRWRRFGLLRCHQLPVHRGPFPAFGAGRRRADQRNDQAGDARCHAHQSQGRRAGHDFPPGRDARHCCHSHLRQDGPDRHVGPRARRLGNRSRPTRRPAAPATRTTARPRRPSCSPANVRTRNCGPMSCGICRPSRPNRAAWRPVAMPHGRPGGSGSARPGDVHGADGRRLGRGEGPFPLGDRDPDDRPSGGGRGLHPPRPANAHIAALCGHAADCRGRPRQPGQGLAATTSWPNWRRPSTTWRKTWPRPAAR